MHQAQQQTRRIIELWKTSASENAVYYEQAEADAWLRGFWEEGSVFFRAFKRLDLDRVLELACGKGRHAAQIVDRCGHLTLMDTSEEGIKGCRERFARRANVSYLRSETGRDLVGVNDQSLSAVYSYDAMVHFEMDCVFAYLAEIHRVLRPAGMALLHHSVFDAKPGGDFMQNPGWRNFMSPQAFRHVAMRTGFRIESMEMFAWAASEVTDGLSLLIKPAG